MKKDERAKARSQQAVNLLGSAIDTRINELNETNRQLKRKIFDLYTIFELTRNFNAVLNYQTLVDSFLLTSLGQVGASSAALFLPSEGNAGALHRAKGKGQAAEDYAEGIIDTNGRLATFITAMARPLGIAELSEHFNGSAEFRPLTIFSGGLIIPLIYKAELKGLVALGGKVSGGKFSIDDIEFLAVLGNQFVVALENARLYESEKTALAELRRTQRQLVLTEKLAAVGELSAKIAHEVNNPLGIISNYLHLCSKSLENPAVANEHLEVARDELGRIARIIRQLLDFHRPPRAERIVVNIKQVFDDVLGLVTWQLQERGIEVREIGAEPIPTLLGSPEQLKQVFLNLLINARDAMPDGGILTAEFYAKEQSVIISISDTGPGIPEAYLSRIFEPFFTTKEQGGGTGLGLAVCFGIIKDHGGMIEAANTSAGGGRFTITLPLNRQDEATE